MIYFDFMIYLCVLFWGSFRLCQTDKTCCLNITAHCEIYKTKGPSPNQTASDQKQQSYLGCSFRHRPQEGAHWPTVTTCSTSGPTSLSPGTHRQHGSKQRGFRGECLQLGERAGWTPFVLSGSRRCSSEPSVSTNSSWHASGSYGQIPLSHQQAAAALCPQV